MEKQQIHGLTDYGFVTYKNDQFRIDYYTSDSYWFQDYHKAWVRVLKKALQTYIEEIIDIIPPSMVDAYEYLQNLKIEYGNGKRVTDWHRLIEDEYHRIEKNIERSLKYEGIETPTASIPASIGYMLDTWCSSIELT